MICVSTSNASTIPGSWRTWRATARPSAADPPLLLQRLQQLQLHRRASAPEKRPIFLKYLFDLVFLPVQNDIVIKEGVWLIH